MLRRFLVAKVQAFCGLIAFLVLFNLSLTPAQAQTDHWLTGYYAYYNDNVMSPSQMDYTKLTHVIFWPAIPNTNATLNETAFRTQTQFDADAKAVVAGAHAAGAKALFGVGGNSDSGASAGFSGSTTPANLTAFVNLIVSEMQRLGFDGVDINWEEISSSSSSDDAQFVAFIGALRTKLNTITPRPLLTMAPAVTSVYNLVGTETTQQLIASVYADFDQLNIQTYVMSYPYCGWETWYNAPLNNGGLDFILDPGNPLPTANTLIASYASAGIPMTKMAVGIQFDSAIWQGGQGTTTGGVTKPHQIWTNDAANCGTNLAAPSWTTLPYRQMITTLAVTAGYTENFDSTADQNWLGYDPSGTGTTNEANDQFVSYDSPQSIAKKGTDLAAQEASLGALGGVMIFELSGDYAGSTAAPAAQHPLLDAANQMANLLPSAVTGLTATPSATSITLNWTATPFASTYQVFKSTTAGAQGTAIGPVTSPTMTVTGLSSGTTYYFQVEPGNSFGYSTGGIAKVTAATTGGGLITPTITWAAPAAMVYLQPLGATQLDATASVAGTFAYSPVAGTKLTAGTQKLSVTFTPTNTAMYTTATASVTVTVGKATSVVSWPTPAGIVSGTALSSTQLDATASVPGQLATIPGTFVYTPAAGTVPALGTDTLSVVFTPTDTVDFTSASASVSLKVYAAATPAIVWPAPAAIAYGTPLSKTQLDATDTAAGTFVYTPAAGTILAAGSHTLSVTFTPSVANGEPLTATQTLTVTAATLSSSPSFGSQPIGVPSAEHVFTFTFPQAYTVTAIQVLTKGAPGLDFTNSGTGTCVAKAYAAGSSCTVDVIFTPTASGIRAGAIVGLGGNTFLSGTGTGAQIAFDPGTPAQWVPSAALTGLSTGEVVDGAGNVYYGAIVSANDATSWILEKMTPTGVFSQYAVGPTEQTYTNQIALDGAGNVYYTSGSTVVLVAPGGTQDVLVNLGPNATAEGLAIDASGNLFVLGNTGGATNVVEEYSLSAGTSVTVNLNPVAGLSVTTGCGLAVDQSDDLFVGDCGNQRIVEFPATQAPIVVMSGIVNAEYFAVGNNGSLYISNSNAGDILKWSPTTPTVAPKVVAQGTVLGNTFAGPVAVDSSENLYVADNGAHQARILEFNRQTPPTITYLGTVINLASAAQSFTAENIGNANLTLPAAAAGTNPAISANFIFAVQASTGGSACESNTATTPGTIAALGSCTYNVVFKPTALGPATGTLTFTDNSGNAIGSTQTLSLAGEGLPATLAAPAMLTATAGPNQIVLNWTASPYAEGYSVYRSTSSAGGFTKIGASATNSYTDTTTVAGVLYYYQLVAYDNAGTSGVSEQVSAKATLPVPTGLTATVSGETINLKWNASAGAIEYAVQRSVTNGGPYNTYLGSTTATTYVDGTAIPGTTYYYVVAAVADPPNSVAIESAYSNQASAKTTAQTLPAPTGLAAYLAQGGGGATLTWPAVTGATGYNILRSTVSGGPYKLVASNYFAPYLRYSDIPLAGGTYYWVIQAQNSSGTSPYSNQASLTVPNLPIPSVPTFSISIYQGTPVVTANNDGDVLFEFYRSSSKSGPYTLMETSDIYNFFDYSAVSGNTYYYELTASNNSGTSAFTAPQSITVPFAPSNVKATAGNGQVALSWTGVSGASSYTVYYGTVAGNPDTEGGPTTATSLLITGLTNGTPYYFEVEATLADGVSTTAFSTMVSATPVASQTITWIPDWDGELLQVRVGSGTSATAITIALPSCNPNSVAVNQNKAYVACNANGANPDKILVYNATTIRAAAAGTLTIAPLQTITSADFNSLIGIAFDGSNDLWVASNGNNEVLEFTAASLATATPTDIVSLINSPASPVALAFDTDGSLWVTGLYGGGILLNFQSSQFGLGDNANPRYCAVTEPQGGICISQANLFLEPEGVAVFNGSVWVANNSTTGSNNLGGATPGRELVSLTYSGGTLAVAGIYGSVVPDTGGTATSPFFCPGGLYATADHLWVNDESYGEATPQCGANGDSASQTGGVFSFTPAQLTAKPVTQAPAFTNVTGRPGFGGIFVEND
jgi:GH18 family chitinase/fibronectin type 3 domain-containing protein/sugar lactone lactonase YvrE